MTTIAEQIAESVKAAKLRRIDAESCSGNWVSADSAARYMALLNTLAVWVAGDRKVTASVTGPDVDIWGYAAAEILDAGSSYVDGVWATGRIDEVSPGRYVLTW